MALTKEQYDHTLQVLRETSMRPEGGITYPEAIVAYGKLAQVKKLDMEAEGFPFTVYQCVPDQISDSAPLFINIHGGGWYVPHEDNDLYFSCWLASQIKGVVLSVDYTTSDQAPWEVMFGQCYRVLEYAFANAVSLGCSRDRISVGGYSAGGHLTAGLALKAAAEGYPLRQQIICYAPLDMGKKVEEPASDAAAQRMQIRMKCFLDLLFRREERYLENPYANPYIAGDEMLKGLPRTLVITAGKCGFRFENEAYGLRMAQQGIEVTLKRFPDARHGFIPHFADYWEPAAEMMVRALMQ